MELILLLIEKIASMFIMMLFGFLIVKCRILKVEDSVPISKLVLYVIVPCCLIDGLQQELTEERVSGILFAIAIAILVHVVFILLSRLLGKPLRLTRVEDTSIVFTNGGALIYPIVAYCLGEEWIFYVCAYGLVQVILFWTYLSSRLSGQRRIELKKILLNINIIAIAAGLILFFGNIRLPTILGEAVSSTSDAVGPVSMFSLGMLLTNINRSHLASLGRILVVNTLRLLVLPLCVCLIFTLTGLPDVHPQAKSILLISLLSASAPPAATVAQMAKIYECEPTYASEINTIGVLICIITMPLIIGVYQMLV